MYVIRKTKDWVISATPSWKTSAYIFIFLPLFLWVIFWYSFITNKDDTWILTIIFVYLLFLTCFYVWIKMYIKDIKINKLKSYKKTWWWIVKKLKITSIEQYYISWEDNSSWFDWHYIEIQEWDKIYCSNAFEWGTYQWTSLRELKKIYKHYWFEYNEKNKNNVIREIENKIFKNKLESHDDWFLKGFSKIMDANIDEKLLNTVKEWYIIPHIEINWHKISVWDTIDVYIDPKDEKNYWVDIDFLFDK